MALPLDLAKKSCFWMKEDCAGHFCTQAGGLVLVDGAAAGQALREERSSIFLLSTTGELLEESHVEASKLRQKAEDLVKDNKMLMASSSLEDLVETGGRSLAEEE